ncbi:MAG: DUF1737 domain-containing protein [Chloroflexi bacterium]|nr:DUF1737 domain-containing protein [Chloroflexota bacterium]
MTHEYLILESLNSETLSEKVTEHLADGFDLWGNPFVVPQIFAYCQAVVRFDPSGHSVVGHIDTALVEPAGYSIQVPETPGGGEGRAEDVPTFEGVPCGCSKIKGDNPKCRVHFGDDGPRAGLVYSGLVF